MKILGFTIRREMFFKVNFFLIFDEFFSMNLDFLSEKISKLGFYSTSVLKMGTILNWPSLPGMFVSSILLYSLKVGGVYPLSLHLLPGTGWRMETYTTAPPIFSANIISYNYKF